MMVSRLRRSRARRDRGAILVEMAFVLPVLMLLVTGMFEMGIAWRHKVSADQAARQAVRVSSHLSSSPSNGDYEAMQALRASLADDWSSVEFVVVYKADTSGEVPPQCLTAAQGGLCNRWTLSDLQSGLAQPTNAMWDSSASWAASGRNNSIDNPDHIGIYVELAFDWKTNMFPGRGPAVKASAVMRVEPDVG